MAAVLIINVKGSAPKEIEKHLFQLDSYMNINQTILRLVSNTTPGITRRVYFSDEHVDTKLIRDIISGIRTDKSLNQVIKYIYYNASLNKV